jgi:hypothetical protein
MKSLFSKVMVAVAGVAALFGISVNNVMAMTSAPVPASVTEITSKSPLYLEHGKSMGGINVFNDHESHSSHESHGSHGSHGSHESGY